VNLDADSYYDGVDITPQDIFKFVAETKILPKTSAPSIGEYEEFFESQLKLAEEVIHFNISEMCPSRNRSLPITRFCF
jgi:fatty acid-binding protein DegV